MENSKMIKDISITAASIFNKITKDTALLKNIEKASDLMVESLNRNGKILICGNGGSAADAQHFAGEMMGSFLIKHRKGIPAIALNADSVILTSISNDQSYEEVFSVQVDAIGKPNDILIAISTSGTSKNIIRASQIAKEKQLHVIALVGGDGKKISELADISLNIPADETPRIQEAHTMIIHMLCAIVEKACCCDRK